MLAQAGVTQGGVQGGVGGQPPRTAGTGGDFEQSSTEPESAQGSEPAFATVPAQPEAFANVAAYPAFQPKMLRRSSAS